MIRNQRSAGRAHWLILPKAAGRHIRDIEALSRSDLPLRTYVRFPSPFLLRAEHSKAPSPHIIFTTPIMLTRLPPVKEMDRVKQELLRTHFPDAPRSSVHSGYHRGRRRLVGPVVLPDIVSVHHLHLHVIVEPRVVLRVFKYPAWLRFMWVSDERVMAETAGRERPRMRGKGE